MLNIQSALNFVSNFSQQDSKYLEDLYFSCSLDHPWWLVIFFLYYFFSKLIEIVSLCIVKSLL